MSGPRIVCNSLCGPLRNVLEVPGLYELDSQSSTRRRGCHCWELQDKSFAFCGRIGTACVDLLNRFFSTHLIDFLLRATKQERKSALKIWGIVSLKTPKAVYSARERKYTAAGGDVQVLCSGIHEWRKSEQRHWCTA